MWKDAEMAQMEAAGALTAMRAELQSERERREWEVAVVQLRSELELQRAEVRRLEGEASLRGVAAVATGGVGVSSVAKAAAVAVGGGAAAAQASAQGGAAGAVPAKAGAAVATGGVGVSSAAKAAAVAVGGGAAAAKATSGVGVSSSAAQAAAGAVAPEDGEWTTVVRRVPESFAAQLSAAAARGVGDVGKIWVSQPPAKFTAGGFGFVCACASCRRQCGVNGGERVISVPAGALWKSCQGGATWREQVSTDEEWWRRSSEGGPGVLIRCACGNAAMYGEGCMNAAQWWNPGLFMSTSDYRPERVWVCVVCQSGR